MMSFQIVPTQEHGPPLAFDQDGWVEGQDEPGNVTQVMPLVDGVPNCDNACIARFRYQQEEKSRLEVRNQELQGQVAEIHRTAEAARLAVEMGQFTIGTTEQHLKDSQASLASSLQEIFRINNLQDLALRENGRLDLSNKELTRLLRNATRTVVGHKGREKLYKSTIGELKNGTFSEEDQDETLAGIGNTPGLVNEIRARKRPGDETSLSSSLGSANPAKRIELEEGPNRIDSSNLIHTSAPEQSVLHQSTRPAPRTRTGRVSGKPKRASKSPPNQADKDKGLKTSPPNKMEDKNGRTDNKPQEKQKGAEVPRISLPVMSPSNEMEEDPPVPGGSGTRTKAGGRAKLVRRASSQGGEEAAKP